MPLLNELTRNITALGHETLQKVFPSADECFKVASLLFQSRGM